MSNKYCEYFDIDTNYSPTINESSIKTLKWQDTYPHETFIKMLKTMELILGRNKKQSLWIEGSYGTGKSQCVYALKKILEVPEKELEEYWRQYEGLAQERDLLVKYIGHKHKKIVPVYRYASGSISDMQSLILAIQESVKQALIEYKIPYQGASTLKDGVIKWIEQDAQKAFLNSLLKQPKYHSLFSESNADQIVQSLNKGGEISELMGNLFKLAKEVGITALQLDMPLLIEWLNDVIDKNGIIIVFIWDEFSDFFKNNRTNLTDFQKLVELCNEKPFYFVIVTHESGQLFNVGDSDWKKLRDRFAFEKIQLPDTIAFDLIGHALKIKPAMHENWKIYADDLNSRLHDSRKHVMAKADIKRADVMEKIMPIQPMTALLLKYIASFFKSNQRSMFEFIKSSKDSNVQAFQWFTQTYGPEDEHPLLTVDMLWDFFYEKGRDDLSSGIQAILDVYPRHHANLYDNEKIVLKTILIMEAIDQQTGGVLDSLKVTDQNLAYAFEGIAYLEGSACINIAKKLVTEGVLYNKPIGNGKTMFAAPVIAGNQAKITEIKDNIKKISTTSKLVEKKGIFALPPALALRLELKIITLGDFKCNSNKTINNPSARWKFDTLIACAKDEAEAIAFRKELKTIVSQEEYKNITFIDALSTPLGVDKFEEYVEFSANAQYHQSSDTKLARYQEDNAAKILTAWYNRISDGEFFVHSFDNSNGERLVGKQLLFNQLQEVVLVRFPFVFDFKKGLTESQLKATSIKQSVLCGIVQETKGPVSKIEKSVLEEVWQKEKYWESQPTLSISKIKIALDKKIKNGFEKDGLISIPDIYQFLENEYGFSQCNLSAFLVGFLVKEYSGDTYRYQDSRGAQDSMSPHKLAEGFSYIGKLKFDETAIVKMTLEEEAFYAFSKEAWKLTDEACSSIPMISSAITEKMKEINIPIWGLEYRNKELYKEFVEKYIELIQTEGKERHKKVLEIGQIATKNTEIKKLLVAFLSHQNCKEGMEEFLKTFEDGTIWKLAEDIGAIDHVIEDIRNAFDVKHACLWTKSTGEDEIKKLSIDYTIVKVSNTILTTKESRKTNVFEKWKERLRHLSFSSETICKEHPELSKTVEALLKIYNDQEFIPEQLKQFSVELQKNKELLSPFFHDDKAIFSKIYTNYLSGLHDDDVVKVNIKISNVFSMTEKDCIAKVKEEIDRFKQSQLKTQLFDLWKSKTNSENPREWSKLHTMPIFAMLTDKEFQQGKKVFEILNQYNPRESEIKEALIFLNETTFCDRLSEEDVCKEAFISRMFGNYATLLTDVESVKKLLDSYSVEHYDWFENPNIKDKIKTLASDAYKNGGNEKALKKIDEMDDKKLKQYLKKLIKENMAVGIEIIKEKQGE